MNILNKAIEYLACPEDNAELGLGKNEYVCKICNKEYPIIDNVPCFTFRPVEKRNNEETLKRLIGEKASSNCSSLNEVSQLAQIYVSRFGPKKAIINIISGVIQICKDFDLNDYQAAALQQAVTEARYDIEASEYRGTFTLPEKYIEYIKGRGFVLEGACGPGENLAAVSLDNNFSVGLDISYEMVRRAQRMFGSEKCLYIQGDVCSLPVRDKTVDVYMSFNALDRVPKLRNMSNEIGRALKPDGTLILGACEPPQYEYEKNGTRIVYVPEEERLSAEDIVRDCGIGIIKKEDCPWKISTILDGTENLTTAVYIGKRR